MAKEKRRYSFRKRLICYNLTIMISVLLLCSSVFLISAGVIIGDFVRSDFDFLMTASAGTMEAGISWCSDVLTNVRKSEIMMQYFLASEGHTMTEDETELVNREFEKIVSLNSQNLDVTEGFPLVEKVCLFNEKGEQIISSYHVMNSLEMQKSEDVFRHIYQRYQAEEEEKEYGYYKINEENIGFMFPVLDEQMNPVGVMLYQFEKQAMKCIMQDITKYEDTFWILCDAQGQEFYGENITVFKENGEALRQKFSQTPFSMELRHKNYQIYKKNIGMGLEIFIGIPKNQLHALLFDSVRVYVVVIGLITVLACAVLVTVIYRMTRPVKEIADKILEVKEGRFDAKLPVYESEEFYEISNVFNEMTAYIEHLIRQVYEKQLSVKDMEIRLLQSQMNPHFMFNVLNTIALKAKLEGNLELHRMISSFNQLIQAKIYRNASEKVQIGQELEYVRYYLYLQSFRFGDRLNYEISIQDECFTELYVPKLCIQLIVENAVIHGIEPKLGKGIVYVRIYEDAGDVCIEAQDDGVGFDEEGEIFLPMKLGTEDKKHNHVGLNNAHHIIRLMYGEPYGIRIFSKPGEGSRVWIKIPMDDGGKEKKRDVLQSPACG